MGIPKNYFRNKFYGTKIESKHKGAAIEISFARLGELLDNAQDALDAQAWSDIKKYMPIESGALIQETDFLNKSTRGEIYLYPPDSDYGHYMYEGIKYVDPKYGIAAFYSPEYGYWSRPGVQKVPSATPLFYQRDTAEAHWDEVAAQNHMKSWIQAAKNAMKG